METVKIMTFYAVTTKRYIVENRYIYEIDSSLFLNNYFDTFCRILLIFENKISQKCYCYLYSSKKQKKSKEYISIFFIKWASFG